MFFLNNKICYFKIYLIVSFFYYQQVFSQNKKTEYLIKHFTTENGLSSNLIDDMNIDCNGLIWLATPSGLCRFDGKNFENYTSRIISQIKSNRFERIFKYKDSNLLVTNEIGQLFLINKFSKIIPLTNFKIDRDYKLSSNKNDIIIISEIPKEILSVKDNFQFLFFIHQSKNYYKILDSTLYYNKHVCINNIDLKQHKWFFLNDRMIVLNSKLQFLIFYKNKLEQTIDLKSKLGNNIDRHNLFFNKNNNGIYLSYYGKLYEIKYKNEILTFELFNYEFDKLLRISLLNTNNLFDYQIAFSRTNGFYFFYKSIFYMDSSLNNSNNKKDAYRIYIDKDSMNISNVLMSKIKKRFNQNGKTVFFNKNKDTICLIFKDSIAYITNNKFITYKLEYDSKKISSNLFYDAYLNNNEIHLFYGNSLLKLNYPSNLINVCTYPKGELKTACKIQNTNDWLMYYSSQGLIYYKQNNKLFTVINKLKNIEIRQIQYDEKLNKYWIFTYGFGIYIIDKYLNVKQIKSDVKNYLDFAHYYLIDKNNFYWLPTNSGIFKIHYNEIKKHLEDTNLQYYYQYFNKEDGLTNPEFNGGYFNSGAYFKHNVLGFSNMDGIVTVNLIKNKDYNIPLLLDKVTINNVNVATKKEFTIKEGKDKIVFKLISANYLNKLPFLIEYQIPEISSNWEPLENEILNLKYLKKGNYNIIFRNIQNTNPNSQLILKLCVEAPWYLSIVAFILYTLVLILFILFLTYHFYQYKQKMIKIAQKITESELKALRSQINPHYLSNSLVSLQKMVLKDDKELAFETLSQYGAVMRNILSNSETQFVTLKNEIHTINEYMKLEGMLHFNQYNFSLNSSKIEALDLEKTMVPSMLIQPFLENAILHGLMPKKEEPKILNIDFTYNNEALLCTIQDNGVGRKVKENINRKSMGNKNVEDRFNLYSKLLNQKVNIEVIDLKNDDLKPSGTKVVLLLPYVIEK